MRNHPPLYNFKNKIGKKHVEQIHNKPCTQKAPHEHDNED